MGLGAFVFRGRADQRVWLSPNGSAACVQGFLVQRQVLERRLVRLIDGMELVLFREPFAILEHDWCPLLAEIGIPGLLATPTCHHARRILRGRQTESTRVLAGELGGALIAHIKRGCGNAGSARRQNLAGLQQAKLFLVLKRAQRGGGFEVAVER